MNNQNCFDFLIDLALDNKDFNWIKQIQELKEQARNNIADSDLFDIYINEFGQMELGQALILAHVYHCAKDLGFSSENIIDFIYEYIKMNPNIDDYMDIILNKMIRG